MKDEFLLPVAGRNPFSKMIKSKKARGAGVIAITVCFLLCCYA